MQLLLVVSLWYYQLRLLLKHTTHRRQEAGSLQEAVSRQRPVSPPGKRQCGTPLESSWSTKKKEVDVRKKSTLVCVFFFCLFLHFIIKNKSVFVLYNTIQHPHRGSINHQSSTDKKRNSFLVVSLDFFFFLPFKGFLKKTGLVVVGGLWREESGPWTRRTGIK